MEFACIYVPEFTVQAIVRAEPALSRQPVAILDEVAPLEVVVAANEAARRAGVQCGIPKSQLEQFSLVQIRRRSPAQEAATHATLLDLAWSFSPRIEETARDTVVLELAGLAKLWGSPEQIARKLAGCTSTFGLEVHAAVAANPDAAIHAARGFPGITVIPAGKESEYLSILPLSVLAPQAEILETLERWGVRNFQDFARLPTAELAERLGQEGLRLQGLARGTHVRSLVAAQPTLRFEEVMELDNPIGELEPLSFILGRLLDQLCNRLSARSLAIRALRLELELESGIKAKKIHAKTLNFPVPMRGSKMLLKLLRTSLQANPPPAPILKVALAAEPALLRVMQGGLFVPLEPDPEKVEVTLARIAHVVGNANVGSPEIIDTHRPGAVRMGQFAPPREEPDSGRDVPSLVRAWTSPPMAFRVFRPPLQVRVEVRQGIPVRVLLGHIRSEVVAVSGPWRTSGDWWTSDGWEQDEWDVELQFVGRAPPWLADDTHEPEKRNGRRAVFRVYRDLPTGKWFLRGAYD